MKQFQQRPRVVGQAGRVNRIIPTPNGKVANLTFGGPDFDMLYVTCGDRVYKRKGEGEGGERLRGADQAGGAAAITKERGVSSEERGETRIHRKRNRMPTM